MLRSSLPIAGLTLAALLLGQPSAAPAQSDAAALDLIEQLRPRTGTGTRGIRMPAPVESPAAAQSTPAAAAPIAPPTVQPSMPAAAFAPRPAHMSFAAPSVSITVTFPTGSATLTSQAEQALAPLGRALSSAELAPFRFRIEGHTDTAGDAATNQVLSERRAAAVRQHLIERYSVAGARLEAVGLGESRLAVATPDSTAEPRNRRVQVVNLDG